MMSWSGYYSLPGNNYDNSTILNNTPGVSQTAQYAMASNAVNYAQANFQQPFPQTPQFSGEQTPSSMMPQHSAPQFHQTPYSASWPLVDAESSGTSGPSGPSGNNNNSSMGLFNVGVDNISGIMGSSHSSNNQLMPSPDGNSLQQQKSEESSEMIDASNDRRSRNNQPYSDGEDSRDHPIRRPQGYGWPKNRRERRHQKAGTKMSTCPICQTDVFLDNWVEHATSHANMKEKEDDDNVVDSTSQHSASKTPKAEYLFIQDFLKSASDKPELLDGFSCQFCKVEGLSFESMLTHIQELQHMHNIYRWISLPSSTGHSMYKEHIPEVPIKSRHLKFHFCEVCLVLAGWHDNAIAKHLEGKSHISKIHKLRENLEWTKRGNAMRSEKLRGKQLDLHFERNNQKQTNAPKLPAPLPKSQRTPPAAQTSKQEGSATKGSERRQPTAKSPVVKISDKRVSKKRSDTSHTSKKGTTASKRAGAEQRSRKELHQQQQYPPRQQQQLPLQQPPPQQQQYLPPPSQYPPQQQPQYIPQQQPQYLPQQQSQQPPQQQFFDNRGMPGQSMPMNPNGQFNSQMNSSQMQGGLLKNVFAPANQFPQQMQMNMPDAGPGSRGGGYGVYNQQGPGNQGPGNQGPGNQGPNQQQFQNNPQSTFNQDGRISNFVPENSVGNAYQSRPMEPTGLPPPSRRRSKSPEKTGPTVFNRNKLQELVHSIRSTSTVENEAMDSHDTARSKAAVLAMLKSPSAPERTAEENPFKERQGDYLRERSPDLFITERRESRREPSPYSRGRSPVRAKRFYSPERRSPRLPPPNKSSRRTSISPRRASPHRESRYSSEKRLGPRREGRYSSEERFSPSRRERDYQRERSGSPRVSYRNSRSSPNRMRDGRQTRSPKRRDYSPLRKASLDRQANSSVENKMEATATNAKPLQKRLCPLVLDAGAREALTKKIEATWQKYYHKYYCCVATNPEIVLEMQKEYLRSYRGFFQDDPHFECYYVKVAKPEDLREALTLRIDRGSPGPDPNNPLNNPYSELLQTTRHEKGFGHDSWSPDGISRVGNAHKRVRRSRSPRRISRRRSRSPRKKSKSPRRRGSPRRKSRSPWRKSRSPHESRKALRRTEVVVDITDKQRIETYSDTKTGKVNPLMSLVTQKSSTANTDNVPIASVAEGSTVKSSKAKRTVNPRTGAKKQPNFRLAKHETDEVKRIATQLLNSAKNMNEMRKVSPPFVSNPKDLSKTRNKRGTPLLPAPDAVIKPQIKKAQSGKQSADSVSNKMINLPEKAENNRESVKQPINESMKASDSFPVVPTGGMFPEKSNTSALLSNMGGPHKEDRFQERDEATHMPHSENEPIITSTTQGFPVERKRIQARLNAGKKQDVAKSGSVLARLGPRRKTGSLPQRRTTQLERDGLTRGQWSSQDRRRSSQETKPHERQIQSPTSKSTRGSKSATGKPSQQAGTDSFKEILSDPFLGFVHKTLTGIILIGQYQSSMATSPVPGELMAKINVEQEDMHARMITSNGHLLIQLARCCIENPNGIEKAFPQVNKDIGPILRNLDRKVISLIADTPIVIAEPAKRVY